MAVLVIAQFLSFSSIANSEIPNNLNIKIGTYQYPNIDRKSALLPISRVVEKFNNKVTIRLAESPSELASLFAAGEIHISVPNLSGFVSSMSLAKDAFLVAVPDNSASDYTSSIISSETNQLIAEAFANSDNSIEIAMVWPDSVSGAIIAKMYMESLVESRKINKLPESRYMNSHDNVLDVVASKELSFGVVATQAYLKYKKKRPELQLYENWRSDPIPFGPIICHMKVVKLCQALQSEILNNKTLQAEVLNALKLGWPEFATSKKLVKPDKKQYEEITNSLNHQ